MRRCQFSTDSHCICFQLQPTWTSYVDTENPVHPGAPDRLERSLIQDVDVKLAEAESLVAELTLDRLGKDNDGGEDNCNLEAIFERKRRISRALDLLQQKMIYGEGGHKLACSGKTVPIIYSC